MIIVPRHKELILPIRHSAKLRGRFKLETQAPGQPRRLRAEFPNLVTNLGLDNSTNPSGGAYLSICAVGSGNATPLVTNTALQTLVGSTNTQLSSSNTVQSTAPYYGTQTITYDFAAGVATGNLAEVGVGNSTTALFSRALIVDGSGNPTTITVLSSESLYVTYTLEQVVPTTDVVGTVTISGTSYGYTLRAANATDGQWSLRGQGSPTIQGCIAYNGSIGTITGLPSGTQASADSVSTNSYSSGSYALTYTATWGLTSGNLSGGISALEFSVGSGRGIFQIGLGTAIPKDGSHILVLDFGTTWSR